MTAGWIAAEVRGRGLLRRRLGEEGAERLAGMTSLEAAMDELATTAYIKGIRPGIDLGAAQHAVSASVLWHLRVLAGWGPPLSAGPLRVMAAPFEIANITEYLARFQGVRACEPFDLGSLGHAWRIISKAGSPSDVRAVLRSSLWGDPGSDELPAVQLALKAAWTRLLFDGAPGTGDLAIGAAALLLARTIAAGAKGALGAGAARDLTHVLGPGWERADSIDRLTEHLPRAASRVLRGVDGPADIWRAEARWWSDLDTTGHDLLRRPRRDVSTAVGVAARMLADSWRIRAALAIAAEGGGQLREVLRGVA